MARLRQKKENDKVSKKNISYKCAFIKKHDTILFSFKYITNQDNFNFQKFVSSQNIRQDIKIMNDLHERLNLMSKEGWEGLRKRNKNQGGRELLDYSDIRFNAYDPNNDLQLSNDSKIISIRFGGNKYRLIGYRSTTCQSIFHVLGFDFNFSAYDHGS